MTKKFLTPKRLKSLQESIDFLGRYQGTPNEEHIIGSSIDDKDPAKTQALKRLGLINKEREELIKAIIQD